MTALARAGSSGSALCAFGFDVLVALSPRVELVATLSMPGMLGNYGSMLQAGATTRLRF